MNIHSARLLVQGWGFFRSRGVEELGIEQKAMGHSEQDTSVSLVR